jgi:hypothetical protein
MVPRLEQDILIFGYTIPEILVLVGVGVIAIIVFQFLMRAYGFVPAFAAAAIMIGVPALFFRMVHSVSDGFLENLIYFEFFKPNIYLPGKED